MGLEHPFKTTVEKKTLQEKLLLAAAYPLVKVILAASKNISGSQRGRHLVAVYIEWVKVLAAARDHRYCFLLQQP